MSGANTRYGERNDFVPKTTKRPPVSDRQLEMLLAAAIRKDDIFQLAKTQLTPGVFPQHHNHFALLWTIVLDCQTRDGELPDEETICGEVERRIDRTTSTISSEQMDRLDSFLRVAFGLDVEQIREKVVYRLLREYLEDQMMSNLRSDLVSNADTPEDPYTKLTRLAEKAGQIRSLQETPNPDLFSEGWEGDSSLAVRKVRTGIEWMDNFFEGGPGRGEAVGLLGPHGSCKTTIAVQTAVSASQLANREWKDRGRSGRLGHIYMFIYEGSVAQMRLRALSYAAKIHRASLEEGDPDVLSTPRRLKPYEQALFASSLMRGEEGLCERERKDLVVPDLNRNLRIFDMTGADQNFPGRGWGLCPEIASIISADLRNRETPDIEPEVDLIIVDYVGAAVHRYLEHHNLPPDRNLRHLITRFPLGASNQLARKFDCPVLLNHQFSGAANSKDPTARLKGTDAAESKSFRENLDFLLLAGAVEQQSQLLALALDKRRRGGPKDDVVLHLRGELSRVDRTTDWIRDSAVGRFVSRSEAHAIGRGDEAVERALRVVTSDEVDYEMGGV